VRHGDENGREVKKSNLTHGGLKRSVEHPSANPSFATALKLGEDFSALSSVQERQERLANKKKSRCVIVYFPQKIYTAFQSTAKNAPSRLSRVSAIPPPELMVGVQLQMSLEVSAQVLQLATNSILGDC
jgi:hypothetical protein